MDYSHFQWSGMRNCSLAEALPVTGQHRLYRILAGKAVAVLNATRPAVIFHFVNFAYL
ncbi:hypothetical protein SAMN05192553_101125 [Cyclobacterium xiamenense]|uniref:Uncharacterized protein n=1 Tax=Cyclobacterium xiamenense TaxID=1297121 RepID=A0A1H6TEM8_9BACT|nr:hypothetical protein SAMN05192553_101125 [Cyclobacterium xiamenense]